MNIARPSGGFHVVVNDDVQTYIQTESKDNFRVPQLWADLLDRIKIIGLRSGTPLGGDGPPAFSFIADGAPDFKIPTIQIVYTCFGDTLTVFAALIWGDGDHELDEDDDS